MILMFISFLIDLLDILGILCTVTFFLITIRFRYFVVSIMVSCFSIQDNFYVMIDKIVRYLLYISFTFISILIST